MSEDALSQEAIDRLLREMAEGKPPEIHDEASPDADVAVTSTPRQAKKTLRGPITQTTVENKTNRRIRDYDFRRPNRISKEFMRGLRLIHETFARDIPRVWGPLLRAGGQVKIISMEQTIYEEYRNHLAPHCFICTATMPPLEGEIAFQIDLDPSFIIVDRLLGGPGTGLRHTRELTSLELSILQRIIAALLPVWREAWLPIIHLEPSISRMLASTEFLQLTAINESVLVTTFQARFLNTDIEISICIPYAVIAPILTRVVLSDSSAGPSGSDEIERERLTRRMRTVPLSVAARLGAAPIPISDLSHLVVGDVIRLDTPADSGVVTLNISDKPYFHGRPGRSNGNFAVQVTDIAKRSD